MRAKRRTTVSKATSGAMLECVLERMMAPSASSDMMFAFSRELMSTRRLLFSQHSPIRPMSVPLSCVEASMIESMHRSKLRTGSSCASRVSLRTKACFGE